jgi:hypothetical protein
LTGLLPRYALAVLLGLAGAGLAQPAFAKGGHAPHAKAATKNGSGKGAQHGPHPPAAPGAESKSDAGGPAGEAPIGKGAIKTPDTHVGFKPKVPQIPHNAPPANPATITRNAIGVPVAAHGAATGTGRVHLENAPAGVGLGPKPIGLPAEHPAAVVNGGTASSGKISGTSMIRPIQAPARLGGPAKPVAGINGTTLRAKP